MFVPRGKEVSQKQAVADRRGGVQPYVDVHIENKMIFVFFLSLFGILSVQYKFIIFEYCILDKIRLGLQDLSIPRPPPLPHTQHLHILSAYYRIKNYFLICLFTFI